MLAKVLRAGRRHPGGWPSAAFLFLRGQMEIAVPLGLVGLGLLGWGPFASTGLVSAHAEDARARCRACARRSSRWSSITTAARCAARSSPARHQGASLDALDVTTLLGLLAEIDAESRALLAAYLDRREPGWREHAQDGAAAGQGAGRAARGKMTEEEAYQILGVPPGAEAAEIRRAHRALMKKLHPDQGGSTYLAAQINEAKEVLLRGHR